MAPAVARQVLMASAVMAVWPVCQALAAGAAAVMGEAPTDKLSAERPAVLGEMLVLAER
jgi:hypothetical protein